MGLSVPMVLIWQRDYSMRQRIAYGLGALTVSVSLLVLSLSPWRLQQFVDGISSSAP